MSGELLNVTLSSKQHLMTSPVDDCIVSPRFSNDLKVLDMKCLLKACISATSCLKKTYSGERA